MNTEKSFNHYEVSKRLSDIRTDADLTQAQLAESLGISEQAVKNYEKAASPKASSESTDRTKAIAGMKIETLFNIARKLNVSTDYLLGNTEVKNTNPNIRSASEYTGLSESAIERITSLKDSEIKIQILNFLLEDITFTSDLTNRLFQYCLSSYRLDLAKARRIDHDLLLEQIRNGEISASEEYLDWSVFEEDSLEDQKDLSLFRCNQRFDKILSHLPSKFYETFDILEEDDDLIIKIKK